MAIGDTVQAGLLKADFSPIERGGAAKGRAYSAIGEGIGSALDKFAKNKQEGEAAEMGINAMISSMDDEQKEKLLSGDSEFSKTYNKFLDGELSNSQKKSFLGGLVTFNTAQRQNMADQMARDKFAIEQAKARRDAIKFNTDQQNEILDNQFMQSLMSQTTSPQAQRQADIAMPGLPALGNADARNRFMQAQLQQPQNQVPVSNLGSQDFGRFAREQGLDPTRSVQRMEALRQAELASQPKAPDPQVQIKNENDLRKEFNSLPEVKDFNKVRTSYDKVVLAGENPSAAGDISMIFNYMKILDPGSVVREGEFATAQNAAGVPQRVINQYNKIVKGERLSEDQRSDFMNQARFAAEAQFKPVSEQMTRYQGVARNMGLRLDQVLPTSFLTMGEQLGQEFKTKPDSNSNAITTDQGDYTIPGLSVEAQ